MDSESYHDLARTEERKDGCMSEIFVWIYDHVHTKDIAIAVMALGVATLLFVHKSACVTAWVACAAFMRQLGLLASFPVALLCCVTTVLFIPVDFVLLWSGAVFASFHNAAVGIAIAVVSCSIGVYCGAIVAFLLGKTLLKPRIEAYTDKSPMLKTVNAIIEADGWKFAFVIRLSPLIPNEPVNYACALTSMSLGHYAVSTLGTLPKVAYEVWLAAQAAGSFHSGGIFSLPSMILNLVLLLIMVALGVVGKRKYEMYVNRTDAISDVQRKVLRKRATFRGIDAELRRSSI
mmetsp:Transcript_7003/g.12975  ORF Transcript_7003/g.12975 Transcript_7003/m.12975 type:complete len:290 (-) Transcript_7003:96-965(-)